MKKVSRKTVRCRIKGYLEKRGKLGVNYPCYMLCSESVPCMLRKVFCFSQRPHKPRKQTSDMDCLCLQVGKDKVTDKVSTWKDNCCFDAGVGSI